MYDLDDIREIIFNRLPESMKSNEKVLHTVDILLSDNDNIEFDEEESVNLFIDKFFTTLPTVDTATVGSPAFAYACKYASFKTLGYSSADCYSFTFKDKLAQVRAICAGDTDRENEMLDKRGKLFEKRSIFAKVVQNSEISVYIANAHVLQDAVDVLKGLMSSENEFIRKDAALGLLKELKVPDILQVNHSVDVKVDGDSLLDRFKAANREVAMLSLNKINDKDASITDVCAVFKKEVSNIGDADE